MKPGCSFNTCGVHDRPRLWLLGAMVPSCQLWLNSGQVEVACFLLALPLGPWVLQQLQGVESGHACSLSSADVGNGLASPAVAAEILKQAGQPELSLSA